VARRVYVIAAPRAAGHWKWTPAALAALVDTRMVGHPEVKL